MHFYRVEDVAHHDEVAAQHENGAGIVGCAAVVGGREQRDEVPLGKSLKAIHDALVCSHNHLQLIVLHPVRDNDESFWARAATLGLN